MESLREAMSEMAEINIKIKQVLYHTGYEAYEELREIEVDESDADQLFLLEQLMIILDRLNEVSETLDYLNSPIEVLGVLHKKYNGRYALNDRELTCGCGIEYLAGGDCEQSVERWHYGRIEYCGSDYYIVGASKDLKLEGMQARIRK